MTKTQAKKVLAASATKRKKPTGPISLAFTIAEKSAVRYLAHCGFSQAQIGNISGCPITQFKRAMDGDEKLRDAWQLGVDDRLHDRRAELEKESTKGNVRATELLIKLDHGGLLSDARRSTITNEVNVNFSTAPSAVDGRTWRAALKRGIKDHRPALIEQQPTTALRALPIDPIQAVIKKQGEGK